MRAVWHPAETASTAVVGSLGGDTVTKKEKAFLDRIKKAFPKMSDREKERMLIFGEAISLICDTKAEDTGQDDDQQKGA